MFTQILLFDLTHTHRLSLHVTVFSAYLKWELKKDSEEGWKSFTSNKNREQYASSVIFILSSLFSCLFILFPFDAISHDREESKFYIKKKVLKQAEARIKTTTFPLNIPVIHQVEIKLNEREENKTHRVIRIFAPRY